MRRNPAEHGLRGGYTLIEVLICSALFSVIFLASIALVERERSLSRSMLNMSHVELMSQDMLFDLERELANAFGANPVAVTTVDLASDATDLRVSSTLGFPPKGMLLIDRGTPNEEVLAYSGLEDTKEFFLALQHGQQCTSAVDHPALTELLWTGLAEPLDQQDPPPDPANYDGVALEDYGPVYFRGDGTGFSYRVPVDPAGGLAFLDGEDITWGSSMSGAPAASAVDGWSAIYFQPVLTFEEGPFACDVNHDGDALDVYDVGQLRKVVWNVADPSQAPQVLGLGPRNILQERCNHGGDLDHDGFDDPIFLWNSRHVDDAEEAEVGLNILHVRLFLIGLSDADAPVTREVESEIFLRNDKPVM